MTANLNINRILPERLRFFLTTYFFYILFFLVSKVFFMLYHWEQSAEAGFWNCVEVLWHGLPMDISMSGYLMIIPGLLILASLFFTNYLKKILSIYFAVFAVLISLVVIPDVELYSYWGFRIDKTIFTYLVSPKEVFASISLLTFLIGLALVGVWAYIQYYILHRFALPLFPDKPAKHKLRSTIITLFLLACMILPIRGGVSAATMNVSRVYFSDNLYLNHSATNPVFYLLASLEQNDNLEKQYRFFSDEETEKIMAELMCCKSDSLDVVLNSNRPNIIFIILESFGHAAIEIEGVAPNLKKLTEEGVFFSNFYANSFRTDRGIVSVLGGYPAQPTMSILKYPAKVQNMGSIPKSLKKNGYSTSILYGGDLNFAGIKSFFVTQGVTDITMEKDLPAKYLTAQWGAPDHITFEIFKEQVFNNKEYPYFKSFLTLSSHEPFDVPMNRLSHPYLNSVAYTDSCLGRFIEDLKNSDEWENSLVVLVPDHNMRYPANETFHSDRRYDVFMLWLGGAVKESRKIEQYCSQADIAAILLGQLDIDYSEFIFSKNVLDPTVNDFAFYDFPNGFGMISPAGKVAFDCDRNTPFHAEGESDMLTNQGKAYLQSLYNDILLK